MRNDIALHSCRMQSRERCMQSKSVGCLLYASQANVSVCRVISFPFAVQWPRAHERYRSKTEMKTTSLWPPQLDIWSSSSSRLDSWFSLNHSGWRLLLPRRVLLLLLKTGSIFSVVCMDVSVCMCEGSEYVWIKYIPALWCYLYVSTAASKRVLPVSSLSLVVNSMGAPQYVMHSSHTNVWFATQWCKYIEYVCVYLAICDEQPIIIDSCWYIR